MPNARLLTFLALCACTLAAMTIGRAEDPPKVLPLLGEEKLDLSGAFLGGDAESKPKKANKPTIAVTLTPPDAMPGDEVVLAVEMSVPTGGYTYSNNPAMLGSTRITVSNTTGLEAIDETFTPDHPPKAAFDEILKQQVEKHLGNVTWSRKYRIAADADVTQVVVDGMLKGQACNDRFCFPVNETFSVSLTGTTEPTKSAEISGSSPFRVEVVPARRPGKPEPISLTFDLAPENAKSGETVTLSVTATPDETYHIFALTQDPEMAGVPTTFKLASHPGLEPLADEFKPDHEPETDEPLKSIIQRVHHGKVTWSRKFRVTDNTYGIDGSMNYQICREGQCRPPRTVPFVLGTVAESQPVVESTDTVPVTTNKGSQVGKQGLVPFLITAFIAGFAALLTPCVFPMIPITVSFFLKQSEKEHHRPVLMASTYCIGIVVTFTGLGLLMAALFQATSLNQLANNPWLNLVIAGVLVFFGMNLLGMFEIRIPSSLLAWTSGGQGRGGYIGVLFMALTFTLVSFTCTFAFAGGLLVLAANGEYFWPILGMLAFSAAFSLPFFFLALFPSFLQKLPKSGGWMNTVKVTMGLIECGAAFKFLSVADLAWNPVPMIFDYSMVMAAWIVLSICTGLYLLGVYRLPHDTPADNISVLRLSFAMTFLGLAGYLAVGLFGAERPTGKVWEQIAAFAPPNFKGDSGVSEIGPFLDHDGIIYALDYHMAQTYASKNNQPLFLDFTGVNCVNCRLMEGLMTKPHNRKQLEQFVRVQLYTDNIPTLRDEQRVAKLLDDNRRRQEDWFGDVTLPAYAVVTPDGKTLLATFMGLEQEEGEFAEFLAIGHAKWKQIASGQKRTGTANRAQRKTDVAVMR